MNFDLESWQVIGGGIAAIAIGVENRLSQRKTRRVAQKAVELAEPTGNGFAKKVVEKLERLEAGQIRNDKSNARVEKKIDDHVTAHANADVAGHAVHPRRVLRNVREL